MRRSLALTASAVMIASGLSVAGAPAASAAATCTYRPVLPRKVIVNQSVVGLRIPLVITGPAACRDVSVTASLVHGTDSYFLYWDDTSPEVESVYSIVPGTYRTTAEDCDSHDADYNPLSCSVVPASTVMKYGGRASLKAKRVGKKVTLTAKTARFGAYGNEPTTSHVAIQRLSGHKWKTIKRATAKGKKGYSLTVTRKAQARYRVVAAENKAAFAATSRSVKR